MSNNGLMQIFGEVLFDHFPDGSRVLGGAPFNVAWHLQAFGQAPQFISRVGDDAEGREIVSLMRNWGMDCGGLQTDARHPTGSVRVGIEAGEPHYEIVAGSAYDFISASLIGETADAGILYHGSLALRNGESYVALQALKAQHRGKIFIDVNLRSPWWDRASLAPLLADAHWVKLNEDELRLLSAESGDDLQTAMQEFCAEFAPETLVVTRGAQGALALDRQSEFVAVEPPQCVDVVDTVGAGDAFATVLLLGMERNWSLQTTLQRAQDFASALVVRRGATVAEREFYRGFAMEWEV